MTRRRPLAHLLLLAVAACGGGAAGDTPYTPPATRAEADGWSHYVDAPMVDRAAAARLNPAPTSPEAAVIRFLASRARGDGAWRQAMVDPLPARAERALAEWNEWGLERFQLRALRQRDAESADLRVYFEITFDGRSDEGEDEFELVRMEDGWRVARPPA
jgi:hypothetical protein